MMILPRQKYLTSLLTILFLWISVPLWSGPPNKPIAIQWQNGYSNFIYDNKYPPETVNTFRETLLRALEHLNISDREIHAVFVYADKEWHPSAKLSNVPDGWVLIQFHSGKSYQQLVDELISNSKPKESGHVLASEAKVMSPDHTYVGSGFFIDQEGYLMTCAHVVQENATVIVQPLIKRNRTLTEETYEASIVGKDDFTDLALIKLKRREGERFLHSYSNFPSILIDHREWAFQNLKPGQAIEARGFPGGTPGSETGTIKNPAANRWGIRMLEVTAKLRPGFSGGVILHEGYVIGINTMSFILSKPPHDIIGGYAIDFYGSTKN